MNEEIKVVEEVVTNEAVGEVAKEAAKHIDLVDLGVKGAAILGLITFIGGSAYACKKFIYDKFVKKDKKAADLEQAEDGKEEPENDDFEEDDKKD